MSSSPAPYCACVLARRDRSGTRETVASLRRDRRVSRITLPTRDGSRGRQFVECGNNSDQEFVECGRNPNQEGSTLSDLSVGTHEGEK